MRPMTRILQPDGFSIGLFLLGVVMLFVPLMLMPGLVAVLASLAYWLTMVLVKVIHRRRA